MSTETSRSVEAVRDARPWRPWLRVAGLAAALLLVSEAIWIWQTWPVRELLQPAPAAARAPGAR